MRNKPQRKRGPTYGRRIVEAARDLYLDHGLNAAQIARELETRFPDEETTPSPRTVQDWLRNWRHDTSGRWLLTMGESSDAAVVLRILADLIEATDGSVANLTAAEAEVIGRLGQATPDMPSIGMYRWARMYLAARESDLPIDSLLAYLAFAPWRDKGVRYSAAFDSGRVSEVLAVSPQDRDWLPAERRARHSFSADAVIVKRRRSIDGSDGTQQEETTGGKTRSE